MPNGKSATMTTGQLATSVTAASLIAQRLSRINLKISNMDTGTINVFIGFDATLTATNGHMIKSGLSVELDSYTGPIFVIAASGTPQVSYIEY